MKQLKHFDESNVFFGRRRELDTLTNFVENYARNKSNLLLLRGPVGIGKSSLVHYYVQVAPKNVLFTEVYYNGFEAKIPFGALIEICSKAFDLLANDCFIEFKAAIHQLKNQLNPAQSEQFVLAFPRLRVYLNYPVNNGIELDSDQIYGLLRILLRIIEDVLREAKKKIIFFLDDLHGMDEQTVVFTEEWLAKSVNDRIVWVAAAVDDERSTDFWSANSTSGLSKDVIDFDGLELQEIKDMIVQQNPLVLNRDDSFVDLINQITKGNPLEIKLLIPALIDVRVLFQEVNTGLWDYDLQYIQKVDKSNKTVNYILSKMNLLPDDYIEVLSAASAIGYQFNTAILAVILQIEPSILRECLRLCSEQLLIERMPNQEAKGVSSYRFMHEMIRQAAYDCMTDEKRKKIHFAIGKTYLSSLGYAARERNIYDIVDQFNFCVSYFSTDKDRLELVEMNLQAGKKAKSEDYFDFAQDYFTAAIRLIEGNRQVWERDLVFDVYIESGEVAYLKNDYVSSVMFFESALKYAVNPLQQAKVHHQFLVMQNAVGDLNEAWNSGVKVLHLLGKDLPEKKSKLRIYTQYLRLRFFFTRRKWHGFDEWEELTDPNEQILLTTYMELISAVQNNEIRTVILARSLEICLKKGISPASFFAFNGLGEIIGLKLGQIRKGWSYYLFSENLVNKYAMTRYKARTQLAMYSEYNHHLEHISIAIPHLEQASELALAAGDHATAITVKIQILEAKLFKGEDLNQYQKNIRNAFPFIRKTGNAEAIKALKSFDIFSVILSKGYEQHQHLIVEHVREMEEVVNNNYRSVWEVCRLFIYLIYGKKEMCYKVLEKLNQDSTQIKTVGQILKHVCEIFVLGDQLMDGQNKHHNLRLLKNLKNQYAKKAKINPSNYVLLHLLALGVLAEVRGEHEEAYLEFRAANAAAYKFEFIHFNGLILERIARLYTKQNLIAEAKEQLQQARRNYLDWGAVHKAELIQQELTGQMA